MKSVLEEIYNEMIKNGEEDEKASFYCADSQETAELLKEFKDILLLSQRDLFAKLWQSVLKADSGAAGLERFKCGFKMGFTLACECLKG